MAKARAPILPPHIEDTVQAIAEVHLEHHRRTTPVQRAVDRMTKFVGRPRFVFLMAGAFLIWVGMSLGLLILKQEPFDAPPFSWLELVATLMALFISVFILITQRRENELAEHREQLTLELAILSEKKSAKIIELLEELRRDMPTVRQRTDAEAAEMARPADPQAVLQAITETHDAEQEQ